MTYLKVITPINIVEEKEKFFASKTYSPQLEYRWDAASVEEYKRKMPRMVPLIDALIQQDGGAIVREASKYFDVVFRPEDIALAKSLITTIPVPSNGTAQEYAAVLERKLADLGIDYKVEIVDKHGFQGRPDHKAHIMHISKHLHLQFLSLDGIANHELVHIIRAVNGKYNGISPDDNYLPTEEGLACLVQDNLLAQPSPSVFQHALEYLAAGLSRTAGFREVYNFLIAHGSDPQSAWLRGIRQKFGMRDTSQPGGLVKSGMYFYHEQLLRELDKSELIRLFVGKIPLSRLPEYPSYGGELPRQVIEAFLGY